MPITTTSAPRQLSDNNGANGGPGTLLGQSAADKVGFFGATPVVQPAGVAEAADKVGQAGGSVMTFSSRQSPSGVTTLTTAEYALTVTNGVGGTLTVATNDVIIVNKFSAQAGLGVGNVRQSAAGVVGLTFQNYTGTMITPTASHVYGIVALRGMNTVTAVLTPAAVAASTTAEQIFTVPGAAVGQVVVVNKPTTQAGLDIAGARVAGNNQIGITFVNVTAGVLTPTAGQTYSFFSTNGIDAASNDVILALAATTPGTVAPATSVAITLSSANVLADDTVVGVQKPTLQAGLIFGGGFVTAAGQAVVVAGNLTLTTITPTVAEAYTLDLIRNAPGAPCVTYAVALSPAAVAANTTAEQTFTVTGVVAGSVVVVNKPSAQAGLGIVGARVSAANTIGITFCNATAATITPTAGETYGVANFQALVDLVALIGTAAGNAMIQGGSPADVGSEVLADSLRTGLVGLGLIAGA